MSGLSQVIDLTASELTSTEHGKVCMRKGWSIDREDWEQLHKVVPDEQDWKTVSLVLNERDMVPAVPGVYAICASGPLASRTPPRTLFNTCLTPLYIGRTESSLQNRFASHCSRPSQRLEQAQRCFCDGSLTFWYVPVQRRSIRNVEAWLIKCYGPPVNMRAETFRLEAKLKPPVRA